MKKFLFFVLMASATVSLAQSSHSSSEPDLLNPELRVDQSEIIDVMQLVKERNQALRAKTAGGVINKQIIGFADTIFGLYGGSAVFGGLFQVPLYSDSTLKQEFTNTTSHIDQHAVSMTYDPASTIWGANTFAKMDPVTIDSVHILGKYSAPSSFPSPTGDSLIVEMTWAPKTPSTALNDAFQSVYYSPSGVNPDTCFMENPLVDVTTPGVSWMLEGTNHLRKGIAITANDLAGSADPAKLYSIAINQLIPADHLVGVSFTFKSAYSGTTSIGDTFFSTVDVENTKIPNFATRLASENIANGFWHFCDPGGMNATGELTSATLYQTNGNFRDGMFAGRITGGYFLYLTVSGTSHFNVKENALNAHVEIYPNPSKGDLNLVIPQGGNYTLDVINLMGQVVYSEELSLSGNEEVNRNLDNLAKGIYLINIEGEGFNETSKFILK